MTVFEAVVAVSSRRHVLWVEYRTRSTGWMWPSTTRRRRPNRTAHATR